MTFPEQIVAIIVAAGSSTRMGADKIWAELAGAPVIAHSIAALASTPGVTDIVVVAPAAKHEAIALLPCPVPIVTVEGGARRQDSVAAGIRVAPDAAWYLVHDGARPLVTPAVAARVLDAAGASGAAIPVVPVVDTIKRVDEQGRVRDTLDRSELRAVQTPQVFRGDLLRRVHFELDGDVTDDAAMLEQLGIPVATVEGDRENLKITTPSDLAVAQALFDLRSGSGGT
ncbi:MAG: 2-C-methyl-D-erythritol 4-phosphate cytidylyltransferase [Dehalococcoidia bacterium]|nr:2-C-methyl-D-erythritol 4-phosphate cytidylyltransferase [Dehalococcoidia bacterium]MCA9850700.1 2-C-methyl-D-erythritol 4-phosphate cytidylyltransferase [Dehalococcoidia bacterium]MCB9483662.1 2-C-methyl-D-erythritol 4-phosphate cytidylyltransferase [Dehalococcoidia bacterium]MCB9491136.1 2-C-methyl-D-erythritol 4-phosphate cytidylyltransferase [Dehalococcoidia bacterium]